MTLPNGKHAIVEARKLSEYLLSTTHAVGRTKAKYFLDLGYREDSIDRLKEDLLKIALASKVTEKVLTPFGMKYVIDAELAAPAGVIAKIRTVWVVEQGETSPRFVTAYPTVGKAKE